MMDLPLLLRWETSLHKNLGNTFLFPVSAPETTVSSNF
jgi:hypothetical protein